jgi:hypothetical protein
MNTTAPAVQAELTRCDYHRNGTTPATMLQAAEDTHLYYWGTATGKFLACALSMGGGDLGPACCPAAAHARFLQASAFRTYQPGGAR